MKRWNLNGRAGKLALVIVVAAAVLTILVWTASWLHFRFTHVITDDARVDGEVITLSSRVAGWVTTLPVIEGDPVRAGQIVVTIDEGTSGRPAATIR